jgi:hypothetical protein
MVAGRCLAVPVPSAGEEPVVCVAKRRPRRRRARGEVDGAGYEDKARAAETSSSMSGNSVVS